MISLPINLGIGGCMQTGYRYAYENNYDIVGQIDGDGQHDPSEVKNMLKCLIDERANLVIGCRFIKKGYTSTFMRRIGIAYFTMLIKQLTGKKITDPTSGFRICDKKVIEYFSNYYPKDYPEPESIVTLIREEFNVRELETNMRERNGGVSSIRYFRTVYYMIKVTLAIMIDVIKPRKKIEF